MHEQQEVIEKIKRVGLSFDEFRERWLGGLDRKLKDLSREGRKYLFYARYNEDRFQRVMASYHPAADFLASVDAIKEPQLWMVITEDWCADAAYSLPVMLAAVSHNPLLTLTIVERDRHLDIMDQFLSNGAQSIPKLVAFSEEGQERFRWGARPQALYALRRELQAQDTPGPQVSAATIDWYENMGWLAVEQELKEQLAALAVSDPPLSQQRSR